MFDSDNEINDGLAEKAIGRSEVPRLVAKYVPPPGLAAGKKMSPQLLRYCKEHRVSRATLGVFQKGRRMGDDSSGRFSARKVQRGPKRRFSVSNIEMASSTAEILRKFYSLDKDHIDQHCDKREWIIREFLQHK